MTRTNKANDIPHNNSDDAMMMIETNIPKFFAKNGFVDTAPSKTKKDGGGKGNWGQPGDEIEDLNEFNMTRPRRYSNSSPTHKFDLKTKFETHDEEPLFDEHRHGPPAEDHVTALAAVQEIVTTNGTSTAEETVTTNGNSAGSAAAGSSGSGEAFRP
ncbi:hypothetical protein DRE_05109 [Drechslerella stenobrocha 248]|uniref:Hyaluronan/mRNA-binding protein domain-containing protein n=1 Tax=Drechslerella stenobrocha 248 TaxID=1043628 RepID=W7HZX2_9PEZI|nr:hypothetical protein DRE_05109 [Drechslerella stenobrocha 248]